MALYFGSRSRFAEYLYGEELEALAFGAEPLIDALRLAFSRDQREKIYIQTHLAKDGAMLAQRLLAEGGSFYLCGPTWPVPAVRAALVEAFGGSVAKLDALKKDERYVLEVY